METTHIYMTMHKKTEVKLNVPRKFVSLILCIITLEMYIFITITESIISGQMYHISCFQRLDNDMVYAYIYYWNLQFINSVIIIKTKMYLNEALVTLPDIWYPVFVLWYYCCQILLKLFWFSWSFWLLAYLMNVIPETSRAH